MSQISLDKLLSQLVGLTEAAEIVGLSKPRLHKIISAGRLPSGMIGSCMVLLRSEVEKFAEVERTTGRPPKAKRKGQK